MRFEFEPIGEPNIYRVFIDGNVHETDFINIFVADRYFQEAKENDRVNRLELREYIWGSNGYIEKVVKTWEHGGQDIFQIGKDQDAPDKWVPVECVEVCPFCDSEVELKLEFKIQECPNCHELIRPCSICETMDCNNCPLK